MYIIFCNKIIECTGIYLLWNWHNESFHTFISFKNTCIQWQVNKLVTQQRSLWKPSDHVTIMTNHGTWEIAGNEACTDSKVQWANMGPIWGGQDPGGPHVGPMKFAIWVWETWTSMIWSYWTENITEGGSKYGCCGLLPGNHCWGYYPGALSCTVKPLI